MKTPVIIAFCKYPRPGYVKTRLAADVGDAAAVAIYETLLAETLRHLPLGDVWLAYDPPSHGAEFAQWLQQHVPEVQGYTLVPQPSGDLGARLLALTQQALAAGATSVSLIGTDCPGLRAHHFSQAWEALELGADVVFGPAADGGYYLQALRQPHPALFHDIPWSTAETLAICTQRAEALGLRVTRLETLRDIDTVTDWQQWHR